MAPPFPYGVVVPAVLFAASWLAYKLVPWRFSSFNGKDVQRILRAQSLSSLDALKEGELARLRSHL